MRFLLIAIFLSSYFAPSLTQASGATCPALLKENSAGKNNALELMDIVDKIDDSYKGRHFWRRLLGNKSKRVRARIEINKLKIKDFLREGNSKGIWQIIDGPFIKAEKGFVKAHHLRLEILSLRKKAQEGKISFALTSLKIMKKKLQLAAALQDLAKSIDAYEAYRLLLEKESKSSVSQIEYRAKRILKNSGIANQGVQQFAPVRDYMMSVFGSLKPDLSDIKNEVFGKDFSDGSPRPLADQGLFYKVSSEKSALRIAFIKDLVFNAFPSFTKFLDSFNQYLIESKLPGSKQLSSLIGIFTENLRKIEAITKHLVDIIAIDQVDQVEQVDYFLKTLGVYGQKNKRSLMSFLESFARSVEHRKLWWEISTRMILESTHQTYLLEKYFLVSKTVNQLRLEISSIKEELELIEDGTLKKSTAGPTRALKSRVKKLEEAEKEFSEVVKEIDTIKASLITEIKKGDSSDSRLQFEKLGALKDMIQADSGASSKPALSYELGVSPHLWDIAINAALYTPLYIYLERQGATDRVVETFNRITDSLLFFIN